MADEEAAEGVQLGTVEMEFDPTQPASREHVRYRLRLAGEPRMPRVSGGEGEKKEGGGFTDAGNSVLCGLAGCQEYIFQRKESIAMYLFSPGVNSVAVDGVVTEKFDAQIGSPFDKSYAKLLREREMKSLIPERQVSGHV